MLYDITIPEPNCPAKDLGFYGVNSKTGETLGATSKSFTRNGKPWSPVMGEFHFSRYPHNLWEEEILKMKAGGISIIASYIFWIHHEEIKGEFDWSGDKNLDKFLTLCEKHDIKMILRLGPWAHGECRNGGFPDWLQLQKEYRLRSNHPTYLNHVSRFFGEIAKQSIKHLFKDGGCVIGVQIENEYGHCGGDQGDEGITHMMNLKKIAIAKGFDVPYYTATGWGGAIVVEGEMLPFLGAYADAPWDRSLEELPANENYIYSGYFNDDNIGSDLKEDTNSMSHITFDFTKYPYATAELGGGIQVTHHRRPVITALDTQAITYARFGSGCNLLGYYMYHGGTNPEGKLTTLEESLDSGGYNNMPILSYDFQAVIGEYGELHQSYKYLKILHMMINDFGEMFADADSYIPPESSKEANDTETLRFAFLKNPQMGLLCLNNHQRHRVMKDQQDINITVDGITFPSFNLDNGMCINFPFNWKIANLNIKYATAQPLCHIERGTKTTLFFWNYAESMSISLDGNVTTINQNEVFTVNENVNIILLSRDQAENAWKVNRNGQETLIITKAGIINPDEEVIIHNLYRETELLIYPPENSGKANHGIFHKKIITPEILTRDIKVACETVDKDAASGLFYKIHLPDGWSNSDEAFLCIDYEGDIASLYHNDKLIADWFYTGLSWRVGLTKFFDKLKNNELILQITPLKDDAEIYLEKHPEYKNHIACKLNVIHLEQKYKLTIQ